MRIVAAIVALCLLLPFLALAAWRWWTNSNRRSDQLTFGVAVILLLASCMVALARPSPYPPVTQFNGDRFGSAHLGPEVTRAIGCPPPACVRKHAGKVRYLYPTRKRPPVSRQKWRAGPTPAGRPVTSDAYRVEAPISLGEGVQREASRVIGGRPAGCPHRFCGCGASLHLFGRIIPALNLAANWLRFPRSAPAPDMVAARRGHVFVLKQHIAGNTWLVHDSNSGRGRTRLHPRSIAGYVIVNPRGA